MLKENQKKEKINKINVTGKAQKCNSNLFIQSIDRRLQRPHDYNNNSAYMYHIIRDKRPCKSDERGSFSVGILCPCCKT